MAVKAQVYEELAHQRGYGVIAVHDAFMVTGPHADYVRADGVHPTDSSAQQRPRHHSRTNHSFWRKS